MIILKSEIFFLIFQRRLIKFGMEDSYKQNETTGERFEVLSYFLKNRKQRVLLNGQVSLWLDVNAVVPQGYILGPLLFLIFINDLPEGLISSFKLFTDDTALVSVIHNSNTSAKDLNKDLLKIKDWAF